MKCLTQHLPQTYTLCNPTFKYESSDNPRRVLTKPSKPTYNDGADNEDWDYILYVNDVLGGEHGGDRWAHFRERAPRAQWLTPRSGISFSMCWDRERSVRWSSARTCAHTQSAQ